MILAAGLGTRLRPLTYETPKALVELGGVPMLERVANRLIAAGADRIVVNVSALADQIVEYLERADWGVDVRISHEPDGPLDTGGGLLQAAHLFRGDRPILIHNVDILTDLDLEALYRSYADESDLATLAVQPARSDRYLLFDADGMTGYAYGGQEHRARAPRGDEMKRDYLGVQVVSARLPSLMEERNKFSIFTTYMRLIREGKQVRGWEMEGIRWMDIGTHEQLEAARDAVAAEE